jgi:hypothetical protein
MIEVFRTNRPLIDENPIVLTTTGIKENTVYGEMFIFLRDIAMTGYWLRIFSENPNDSGQGFHYTEDDAKSQITENAKERLLARQHAKYLDSNNPYYLEKRYELTQGNGLIEITNLILHNKYRDMLESILRQSFNDELREYLRMALQIQPPKFEEGTGLYGH